MPDNGKVPAQGARRDSNQENDPHRKDQAGEDRSGQVGHESANPVHELLDSLAGIEVDGGCDDCNAYQTIERVDIGCYVNHVFQDNTCPWWIRHQAATP
jgi:hypothetical protein